MSLMGVPGLGYSSDGGDLSSVAQGFNDQLDSILTDAQAGFGGVVAGARAVFNPIGFLTGQQDQQSISGLTDRLASEKYARFQAHASGQINDGESAWLAVREQRLQNFLNSRGSITWQESAPFRQELQQAGDLYNTFTGGGAVESGADFRGEQQKCIDLHGTWNGYQCIAPDPCGILPQPLAWACLNPGKATAVGLGILTAIYAGPTLLRSAKSWGRAVRS